MFVSKKTHLLLLSCLFGNKIYLQPYKHEKDVSDRKNLKQQVYLKYITIQVICENELTLSLLAATENNCNQCRQRSVNTMVLLVHGLHSSGSACIEIFKNLS
jgi:hypothetical protein